MFLVVSMLLFVLGHVHFDESMNLTQFLILLMLMGYVVSSL